MGNARTNARMKRVAWLDGEIDRERKWIAEHGGDLAGYVKRYGTAADPVHYGNGGEAIYKADSDALARLVAERRLLAP